MSCASCASFQCFRPGKGFATSLQPGLQASNERSRGKQFVKFVRMCIYEDDILQPGSKLGHSRLGSSPSLKGLKMAMHLSYGKRCKNMR